ncbi:hypothetical protein MOQ_001114 [Trypanosoma cruzi marinkellei]|uniref:Uncharacterized protein n=1 Tax=Trypanosoma cruzi marinkellei TaxID=85056 RepID=K2NUM5_TRYCR|nr:hypothetical protein MOQ_001114 [Trypanosoma cruzi marinkellei]
MRMGLSFARLLFSSYLAVVFVDAVLRRFYLVTRLYGTLVICFWFFLFFFDFLSIAALCFRVGACLFKHKVSAHFQDCYWSRMVEENLDDGSLMVSGDAERMYLLDRIQQQKAMEKQQGVKFVPRKGLSTPSVEELQSIRDRRGKQADMMRMKRHMEAVERRKVLWRDYVSYEPRSCGVEQAQSTHVVTTSLEGRAVVLSPLLALFRMLVCNNRAKKRLERLRERRSLLLPVVVAGCNEGSKTVVEVASVVDEHMTVAPACVNRGAPIPKLFLMTGSFDAKPLRSPFVFLSKQYRRERMPEFSLNLTQAVSKEYAAYVKRDYKESSAVTLSDFAQPSITIEAFDVNKRAYDLAHRRNFVLGYDNFSTAARQPQPFARGEKREEVNKVDDVMNGVGLSQELSHLGIPSKLTGPLPEDSMSGSDDEDSSSPFQADISWLPLSTMLKKNDGEDSLRP